MFAVPLGAVDNVLEGHVQGSPLANRHPARALSPTGASDVSPSPGATDALRPLAAAPVEGREAGAVEGCVAGAVAGGLAGPAAGLLTTCPSRKVDPGSLGREVRDVA